MFSGLGRFPPGAYATRLAVALLHCDRLRRLRAKADAVHRDEAIFARRHRRLVDVAHLRQRALRRVMVRHRLEQRAAEAAHRLLRNAGQVLAVALDDEPLEAALEIGLGVPGDFDLASLD